MRTNGIVQIVGAAPNIRLTNPLYPGVERWFANDPRAVRLKHSRAMLGTFTRWVNLHSLSHMHWAYPAGLAWYGQQTKPIYLRAADPLIIPSSQTFPARSIMSTLRSRYFTFSGAWLIAWALVLGFSRIELSGFEMRRDRQYDFERPCAAYWVQRARAMGVDVWVAPFIGGEPTTFEFDEPGDGDNYGGPLYGYATNLPFGVPA